MLRQIRRHLHLIRYYSAARPETAWTRALEWALLAALLLGLPATLICEEFLARPVEVESVNGTLTRDGGGSLIAEVQDPDSRAWAADVTPFGEFTLSIVDHNAGWPFTTMRQRRPPRLDLNVFTAPDIRRDVRLAGGEPRREAIEAALIEAGRRDMLDAWRAQERPEPHRVWLTTAVAAVLWWVLLSFIAFVTVESLRLTTHFLGAHRAHRIARRVAKGQCGHCGYSLRGLEFSARCPECGELVE